MIPYHRTHSSGHRINKLIQEKYKIWVLVAWAYSYVAHLRPNHGAKTEKQVTSSTKWWLGENIVLRLMECLSPVFSFDIFMDYYFTSFRLLIHLGVKKILATGVLNKNRLHKCTIIRNKQLQKRKISTLSSAHQARKQCTFD